MLLGTPLLAQRRTDLPPPESSRAPLLTEAPADSIRYQTAYLHVMELLQALQAGDATTVGMLLENAALGSTMCGSLNDAIANVAARVRRIEQADGGATLALFLDKVRIVDSGRTQVVTAELVILPATASVPVRSSVTLVMDPERAVWIRETSLLEALCNS